MQWYDNNINYYYFTNKTEKLFMNTLNLKHKVNCLFIFRLEKFEANVLKFDKLINRPTGMVIFY